MLRVAIVVAAGLAVAGCASVPTAAPELQTVALTFKPSPGWHASTSTVPVVPLAAPPS